MTRERIRLGGLNKRLQLENLLDELVDLYDSGVVIVSPDATMQEAKDFSAIMDDAAEVLAIAALEEDEEEDE